MKREDNKTDDLDERVRILIESKTPTTGQLIAMFLTCFSFGVALAVICFENGFIGG